MNGAADLFPEGTPLLNGVWHLGPVHEGLAHLYHAVREREQRIHPDTLVRGLPGSGARTPHAAEWRIRARSLRRLRRDLREQGKALRILDIGCGNGWMSAALAADGHEVVAMDAHLDELEQAARVFADRSVTWCLGDPRSAVLKAPRFQGVVFAASLQYFPDLSALFTAIRPLLAPDGCVHVLDTVLYDGPDASAQAVARSAAYYRSIGAPDMVEHYHAHALGDLLGLGHIRSLSTPTDLGAFGALTGLNDPFHHLVLHPHARTGSP